jgi:hypothetical protein
MRETRGGSGAGDVRLLFPTGVGNVVYASNGIFLAAMADFDFKPLVPWLPLGVNGVYSIVSPIGTAGNTQQEYGAGLYYTGHKAVAVGIEVDW